MDDELRQLSKKKKSLRPGDLISWRAHRIFFIGINLNVDLILQKSTQKISLVDFLFSRSSERRFFLKKFVFSLSFGAIYLGKEKLLLEILKQQKGKYCCWEIQDLRKYAWHISSQKMM